MASQNLEHGIIAIKNQQHQEGQRLLKIALKKDSLTPQERVLTLLWLAETYTDPQLKIQQYQQANQIDPSNQEVIRRLYALQQESNNQQQNVNPQQQNFQQGYSPAQELPPINQDGWQNTPSQAMPPSNPNNWSTDTQGIPIANPNMPNQDGWQGNQAPNNPNNWSTDTQGIPIANPNMPNQSGWQRGNIPSQPIQPLDATQNWQNGLTPSQGMPSTNPNQQNNQQNFQQQGYGTQAHNPQGNMKRQDGMYGKTPPLQIQKVQRSVGVFGGPNGSGTGFFVTLDGLIVTTRYIVGGEETVRVQLLSGQYLDAYVVRSFPEFDLSLIQVNAQLSHVMAATQMTALPHNMDIVAVPHAGDAIKSTIRATRHVVAPHWFPTVINDMPDVGGYPVFDEQRLLVGMLTKNASRSNQYLYGLNIYKIYQCVNIYGQEKQQFAGHKTCYCYACGQISRAPSFGGFFCEHCGNTLPYAVDADRFPQPNLGTLYGESGQSPCPNCHSRVGFYNGECQRCGYDL